MRKIIFYITLIFAGFILSSGGDPVRIQSNIKTIVIDPGHGGRDPGNLGTRRYKTTEKDVALAVSLKLGAYLKENLPGVKVVFTRTTDVKVPLKERAEIANRNKGDIFISIHCDSFDKSEVHGSTTLILGRGEKDENRIALQENRAILFEDNYEEEYGGFDPTKPENLIAISLFQNNYINQSIDLASKIQKQFKERVYRRDRGVKQQPLEVIRRSAMPAVLVELGFLTNPQEEDFLNSEEGQAYMASAIFRAVRDYKQDQDRILNGQPVNNENSSSLKPTIKANVEKPSAIKNSNSAKSKTKPAKKQNPSVYFSVQLLTSSSVKDLKPANFNGLQNVQMLSENGLYKYHFGKVLNYNQAKRLKEQAISAGYKDAFVIGIKNNKKISAVEARKLLQ